MTPITILKSTQGVRAMFMTSLNIYVTLSATSGAGEVLDSDSGSDTQMLLRVTSGLLSTIMLQGAPHLVSCVVTLKLQTTQNKYHIFLTLSALCGWTIIFLRITGKVLRSVIGFQAKLSIKQPLVRGFLFPFIDGEIGFLGNKIRKTDLIFSRHEILVCSFLTHMK